MEPQMQMQMLPLQAQLHTLAKHIENRIQPANTALTTVVIALIRDLMEDVMRESTSDLARVLREDPLMANEFSIVMLQRAALMFSEKFRDILKKNPRISTISNQVKHLFEGFRHEVASAMHGNTLPPLARPHDAEMERVLLKLHEKNHLCGHFSALFREGKIIIRPIELRDVEGIRRLYTLRQYSVDQLVDLAMEGYRLRQHNEAYRGPPARFLKDFDVLGGEGPVFRELLEITADEKRMGIYERRRVETIGGCVAASTVDPGLIHGAYVVGRSPMNPKTQNRFIWKKEEIIETGYSGGEVYWGKPGEKNFYSKNMLEKPSSDLKLIVSEERGVADALHERTWARDGGIMGDIDDGEWCFTFTSREMGMRFNGKDMELDPNTGYNDDFGSWGPLHGYKSNQTWDENRDPASHRFDEISTPKKKITLESWLSWVHMNGYAGRLRRTRKKRGV